VAEFLLGLLGNLLAAEIRDWLPRLSLRILKYSLKQVPTELSERLSEEWHAVLIDNPGGFSKVKCAIGFLSACPRVRHEFYLPDEPFHPVAFCTIRALDAVFSSVGLLLLSPILIFIALIVAVTCRGQVVVSEIQLRNDGSPFRAFWFRTTVADSETELSPVGRWLESSSLHVHMLLLLFNVLMGDLSIVGKAQNRDPIYPSLGANDSATSQLRPGMFIIDPPYLNMYLDDPLIHYFLAIRNIIVSSFYGMPPRR
jgi:hypothetical protein